MLMLHGHLQWALDHAAHASTVTQSMRIATQELRLDALHVVPEAHVPQVSVLPQPSDGLPQAAPSEAQVAGVQPRTHW